MSARTITRTALICDGCGTEVGNDEQFENAMAARAAAYSQGWRFPNKVNTRGRTVKATSDACPECLPNWEPKIDGNSARWTEERKAAQGETMRGYAEDRGGFFR